MASPPPAIAAGAIEAGRAFLDAATLHSLLTPSALVPHLRSSLPSLSSTVRAPPRQSFSLDPSSSSLILMPSWSSHPSLPFIGVKIVTSFPHNSALRLPGVHAAYILFRSSTGVPLATLDGTALTLLRTSAVSALAAALLAREDSHILVMAGAGALAPYLIAAHRFVLPGLNRIIIWNRTPDKARSLARDLQEDEGRRENSGVIFEHAVCLDEVVGLGDVVSCATSSASPIVKGNKLKPGAHLDLVGSFTPAMRECDEEALARGRVFVDFDEALEEAGELVGAFQRGVMEPGDVAGTLAELVGGVKVGRRSPEEVTVFKSVGTAVVDLLAAQLAYDTCLQGSP